MGILNVTPDSFSDGGRYLGVEQAVDRALKMAADGADFIDVGGESSRPGAESIPLEEEAARVLPVIHELAARLDIPLSIDTCKAEVARRALLEGAQIINDITGLRGDSGMVGVASKCEATVILMHMRGEPRTMQQAPHYEDVIAEIRAFLQERLDFAQTRGVAEDRILIDPGIGFGKRIGDNYTILRELREFSNIGPILIGPSRKNFIGSVLNAAPQERVFGTAAAVTVAVMNGARVIRVHDVAEMRQVVEITHQCMTRSEAEKP
jgi:dihydropteroate synthase